MGHTSAKFTTNKAHIPGPVVDHNAPHPLYAMDGRKHYDAKLDRQADWKPSLKTGNEAAHAPRRPMAVKHIEFKPIIAKGQAERLHLTDKHGSLVGPTNDNMKVGLRAFDNAN